MCMHGKKNKKNKFYSSYQLRGHLRYGSTMFTHRIQRSTMIQTMINLEIPWGLTKTTNWGGLSLVLCLAEQGWKGAVIWGSFMGIKQEQLLI